MDHLERQPLLPRSDEDQLKIPLERTPTVAGELAALVFKSSSMAAGFLLESLCNLSAIAIAGRLGPIALATVGQGGMVASVTTGVTIFGATSTQIVLSSPLFTSPKHEKKDVGVIFQRTLVLGTLALLPSYFLWWHIEPIFLWLHQPPSLAAALKTYMRYYMLSQPGLVLMEAAKSYLQVQSMMNPATVAIAAILPFHIALSYLLILKTSLGMNGAAVAITLTNWTFGLILVAYICFSRARECWGGWTWQCLAAKANFFSIWAPTTFVLLTEWASFEIVALFAGVLGEVSIAAQTGMESIGSFLVMIPLAISLACTARIGNLMGLGPSAIPRIKVLVRAAFMLELGVMSCVSVGILVSRQALGHIFTHDKATVALIAQVALPMAANQVFDGLQNCAGGILKATGKQTLVAGIHIISYYAIGLPLGYYLAFHRSAGLVGLWSAQAVALASVGFLATAVYLISNWEVEVAKAEVRGDDATRED